MMASITSDPRELLPCVPNTRYRNSTFARDHFRRLGFRGPPNPCCYGPAEPPGAKGEADNDKPKLTPYLTASDKSVGAAVIVCPGGGYGHLAMDHEGLASCRVVEFIGRVRLSCSITAITVRATTTRRLYRMPSAIRTVRANAEKWKIDPAKIGIMGFSAGGHLASTAGTHFDAGNEKSDDAIERTSCRPDFMILCYPVVSMTSQYTHQGSKKNLLGDHPDPELAKSMSNETQVTPQTPPTFLFHTNADTGVPAENSVMFYLALRQAKVPAEIHIYQNGGHGLGLAKNDPILTTWKKHWPIG